ncbi:MAG: 16S rRNA (cytosine(967)-C(5))-methyltransferase RsmB [Rhodothermales bacterium]|nr:16S rRNA (cytosine(967)-C(5))-methyltransferase RsmB [Rhodothermales bacterium]
MTEKNAPRRKAANAGVEGRVAAVKRLVRITDDGAFASLVGDRLSSPAAERVATQFVGGVTRWRRWLDYLASTCYRGEFDDLEPVLREILRLGTYDLAVVGNAPHAAVYQAVEATRILLRPGAAKLVNAVLRALDRKKPWKTDLQRETLEELSVRWSHPDWLVERWIQRFGLEDSRRLMEYNNRPPAFSLRIAGNREEFEQVMTNAQVRWQPSPWLDDFVRVERLQPLMRGNWISSGAASVQDESAGLVVRLLDPQPGDAIVDACAAPGGKSRYIAERLGGKGHLTAVDASKSRMHLLEGLAGSPNVDAVEADFRDWAAANQGSCDRVLLDAPCTGLGVLSSRADLRWHRTPADFDQLVPLQRELLSAAAQAVRPGGVLVYSTCSIAPEENEANADAFLSAHPEFQVEPADIWLSEDLVTPQGYLSTLPQRDGIDGAFGVRFRRLAD